ncbi:hypothetical protein CCP3SC1_1450002 [Gammaproteobacteria bacterium]
MWPVVFLIGFCDQADSLYLRGAWLTIAYLIATVFVASCGHLSDLTYIKASKR